MDKLDITLKLYGGLERYINNYNHERGVSLKLDYGQTAADLLKKTGIPKNKLVLIMADDKIIHFDYILKQNDVIKMFPPIGGGIKNIYISYIN